MAKKANNRARATRHALFAGKINSMMTVMERSKPNVTGTPNKKSPLLSWGPSRVRGKWLVVDSVRDCALHIGSEAVARARGRRREATGCVVAQAAALSALGPYIDGANVGTNITKVWNAADQVELRFHTGALGPAVRVWDKTGKWVLEDSIYFLRPVPKSQQLNYKPRKKNGAKCARRKTPAQASRTILKLPELRAAITASKLVRSKKK
jgi:hypothetical protein